MKNIISVLIFIVFNFLHLAAQQNIALVEPGEGAIWDGATTQNIIWEAQNVNLISIEFSPNGGNNWQIIEASYSATALTYQWLVPIQPTDSGQIRLTAIDDPNIHTVSGFFTIPQPYINLIHQPGNLYNGQPYTIMWQSSGVFNLGVLYSTNAGTTWDTIAASTNAFIGHQNWSVPNATETCLLKIFDIDNPEVHVVSENFEILEMPVSNPNKFHGGSYDGYASYSNLSPQLQLLSPVGGENWEGGNEFSIIWNAVNTNNIMILFSADGGNTWVDTIQESYPAGALSYNWTIPIISTTQARIKLVSLDVPGLNSESEDFTIPELFVQIQNDFDDLQSGTPYPIFWESSGVNAVNILYSPDNSGSWDTIAMNIPASQRIQNWTVPSPTEDGVIRVSDTSGIVTDEEGTFTITGLPESNQAKFHGGSYDGYSMYSNLEPHLEFVSPVDGDIWEGGTEKTIKWDAINTSQIMLLFSLDGGIEWTDTILNNYSAEARQYIWTVPNLPSSQARFKLISLDVPGLEVESDHFTIPEFFLEIQNNFNLLYSGTPYPILWESTSINQVSIAYSSDSGQSWDTIAQNQAAYRNIANWTVPEPTSNGKIKIWDSENPELFDETELFEITDLPSHNPAKFHGGSYDGYDKHVFKAPDFVCPGDTSLCENEPAFEITGAKPPGGDFSGPGIDGSIFNPGIAGEGIHEITYEYTYFNGSTTSCNFYFTVNPVPMVNCPPDVDVCLNEEPFELTGGEPMNGTYTGDGIDGNIFSPIAAGVGLHEIIYTFTSEDGCTEFCTFSIMVHELPVMACPNDVEVCVDVVSIQLPAAYPEGGEYSGNTVSNGEFYPSQAGVGTHEINYSFSDEFGCANNCVFEITVNPLPEMNCPDDFSVCIDVGVFMLPQAYPEDGVYSGSGVAGNQFDPLLAGLGEHEIIYSFTDENACINTCSFNITVNGLPAVSCPSDLGLCVNDEPVFLAGGIPDYGIYSGSGVEDGIFDPGEAGVGNHEIIYTFSDENSCVNYCIFSIEVHPLPEMNCPSDMIFCINDEPVMLGNTLPESCVYSGPGVEYGVFNPTAAGIGIHEITYTCTNENSCTASCSFIISVKPLPVVSCPGNYSVCQNAEAFELTGATPLGGTYEGNGVIDNFFDPMITGSGMHSISYTYADEFGCESDCQFSIAVLPIPEMTCPGDQEFCLDDLPIEIEGLSPEGGNLSGPGIDGLEFDPSAAGVGDHLITYSYTSPYNFCTNTCTFVMTVHSLPDVSCGENLSICIDLDAFALGNGQPEDGDYSGAGVDAGVFYPAIAGIGTHAIEYFYTDDNNCNNSCSFSIVVNPMPEMACPAQMEVCIYEPAFMLDMASPSGGNYSGAGIEDGIFYPEVAGVGTHSILYQFANEFACEGECSFDIIVHPIPVIGCEDIGQVCKYDEPIDLSMCTPGGGTYESPYVINNTFFPEIAGEGMHGINYHYIDPLTSCETDVTFNIDVLPSQVVNLNSGWAGISSFLIPRSEDIPDMFSKIENQLTILYNLDGNVYYPDGILIPTQPWNMYSGYCIKMNQSVLMNFCGDYMQDLNVPLPQGWSLVPMLSQNPVSSEFVFGFNEDILIVKEVAGSKVLWKEMGISTLTYLLPGEAYYVYCTVETSISYPYSSDEILPETRPDEIIDSPFDVTLPTPSSHIVAFTAKSLSMFEPGDVIGAMDAYSNFTGQTLIQKLDNTVSLAIFGDDQFTEQMDGMTEGGIISYTLFRPSTNSHFELTLTFDAMYLNGDTFAANGISVATDVVLSPLGINTSINNQVKIYPNPSTGLLNISGLEGRYQVEVFNAIQEKVHFEKKAGNSIIDLSSLPKGMYLLRITNSEINLTRKIVLN